MTAEELLRKQVDNAGYQLNQILNDFPESGVDIAPVAHMMTARQIAVHLCETYVAVKTLAQGGNHQWGSFIADAETWPELLASMTQLREDGLNAAFAASNGVDILSDYVVGHDYYHVGQLVAARLAAEPNWDMYVIYAHG